jgi:hypothetical protein
MARIDYTAYDRCPGCKKKCQNLFPDGAALMSAGLAICPKCGCGFLPGSMVQKLYGQKDNVIVRPGQAMPLPRQ